MKQHHLIAGAVLAGSLSLSACSGMLGGELIREGVPTGQIRVENASSAVITVITVSPCDAMSHGLNRLPNGTTVGPNQYYNFTVSRGCYDVQAGFGDGTSYSVADFRIDVPAGRVTRTTVTD